MRQKIPKLVITFSTTTAAMKMESICGHENGRLIPLPREISGSCGLAWCSEPENEKILIDIMQEKAISYEQKRIIQLY